MSEGALPSVNVAMLGASGVGKTSFMAALYCYLHDDAAGLSIRATKTAVDGELRRLGRAVAQGVYPPGTAFRTRYEFLLRLHAQPVLQFHWHDYFGQALDAPDTEAQTRALLADLHAMDALLVFCDSSELQKPRSRMGNILAAVSLANAALTEVSRTVSVVFVLTKADMVSEWTAKRLQPLEGLIAAIASKPSVTASLVPVSCANVTSNVSLPLLFVLHCAAQKAIAEHTESEAAADKRRRYWLEKSRGFVGFLRELRDIWTDTPTDATLAEQCRAKAEQSRRLRFALEPSVAALARASANVVRITQDRTIADYLVLLGGSKDTAATRRHAGVWR